MHSLHATKSMAPSIDYNYTLMLCIDKKIKTKHKKH